MYSSLMTQTGKRTGEGLIRIRPYGAGFGQLTVLIKLAKVYFLRLKSRFILHILLSKPYWLAIRLTTGSHIAEC